MTCTGCSSILGLDEFEDQQDAASSTGGASSSTTGTTSSAQGGHGGPGGEGAGGDMVCVPKSTQPCYTGPSGTLGKGTCLGGIETCNDQGSGYGACLGEVTPTAKDDCATPLDENCDGQVNDDCMCTPNEVAPCYGGPAGTGDVGICKIGTQMCDAQGAGFGPCIGEVLPGTEACNTAGDEDCDGAGCSEAIWQLIAGDVSDQRGVDVGTDSLGNVYLFGQFKGGVTLGAFNLIAAGANDALLAKLDPLGNVLWAKSFGDASEQFAKRLAVSPSGSVVVAGYFQGGMDFGGGALTSAGSFDVFVAKFDTTGAHVWSHRYGDSLSQQALGVAVDAASGDVVVTGTYSGTLDFGTGSLPVPGGAGTNGFLAKLSSAAGGGVWAKAFSGGVDIGRAVVIDGAGSVLTAGEFTGTVSLAGAGLISAGGSDMYVAKFDTNGNGSWSARLGGPGTDAAWDLSVSSTGEPVVGGWFSQTFVLGGSTFTSAGGFDACFAKFSAGGAFLWGKQFGAALDDSAQSLTVSPAGDVYVVGDFQGVIDLGGGALASAGNTDVVIARFNPGGTHVWSKRYGDAAEQFALESATDAKGNLLVTGYNKGVVDFGLGPLVGAGGSDLMLAEIGH